MSRPFCSKRRATCSTTSCNGESTKWEISPTIRGSCIETKSCNGGRETVFGTSLSKSTCVGTISCNVPPLFSRRFQYPGFCSRHCRTRSTLAEPRNTSLFSALLSQRRWLWTLLALRHWGLAQNFCCHQLWWSGTKNSLQFKHSQRFRLGTTHVFDKPPRKQISPPNPRKDAKKTDPRREENLGEKPLPKKTDAKEKEENYNA